MPVPSTTVVTKYRGNGSAAINSSAPSVLRTDGSKGGGTECGVISYRYFKHERVQKATERRLHCDSGGRTFKELTRFVLSYGQPTSACRKFKCFLVIGPLLSARPAGSIRARVDFPFCAVVAPTHSTLALGFRACLDAHWVPVLP